MLNTQCRLLLLQKRGSLHSGLFPKMVTTLQKDEISFGRLETKYLAPDKATKTAVRDMLFKWINILRKL